MGSKSVERNWTPQPTFRRRGDFSPVSTLAAGDFMSEMHEVTPVSQPFPHFERLVDSREAAALLQIHPKTLQRLARKGEIRAMRIGILWRFRTSDLDAWVHLRLKLASYPYRP
jgi:excisionase family DNA binding protein